jgi:predicted MFS family arabinose efflux permease
MLPRHYKPGVFALAALNTIATTFYFNYLFFYLHERFGFDNRQNLWVSALHGLVYTASAWQCGKFAQRRGYFTSLKLGYAALAILMLVASLLDSVAGQLVIVFAYSIALLLTWPALEALASDGENRAGVQRMVGIYNCTWASGAALAFFCGGRLFDLSHKFAVFWLPAGIFAAQFVLASWLQGKLTPAPASPPAAPEAPPHPEAAAFRQPVSPRTFLRMAWLANPFAYVAINTLFATMPSIANKLGLTPTQAGWFCSVWLFGRFAAFVLLWQWAGWHYRFRWLLAAFVCLLVSFVAIVLAPALWVVVLAQVLFGFATGMAYYASLFYSMDAGDAKGEHGGLHEAAIGAGICGGPAIGAAALTLAPNVAHASVWAVSGLLTLGLGALVWLRVRR